MKLWLCTYRYQSDAASAVVSENTEEEALKGFENQILIDCEINVVDGYSKATPFDLDIVRVMTNTHEESVLVMKYDL